METSVNNKCKAFTSLEQSRKLAEILPLESADMCYIEEDELQGYNMETVHIATLHTPYHDKKCIPCWSLTSLLGVLPEIQGSKPIITLDDNYITYPHMSDLHTKADNPTDACVAMVEKLHELKML